MHYGQTYNRTSTQAYGTRVIAYLTHRTVCLFNEIFVHDDSWGPGFKLSTRSKFELKNCNIFTNTKLNLTPKFMAPSTPSYQTILIPSVSANIK